MKMEKGEVAFDITNNNIDSEYNINTNTFSLSKIKETTRLHEINTEEENDDHVNRVLENYGLKEKIESSFGKAFLCKKRFLDTDFTD